MQALRSQRRKQKRKNEGESKKLSKQTKKTRDNVYLPEDVIRSRETVEERKINRTKVYV